MAAFNTPWFNSQDRSFFNSLNKTKIAHLAICAETEDFDEEILQAWMDEGFHCAYVPLLKGGEDFIKRLHTVGDNFGVSEQYAIVAYGTAANLALQGHTKPNHPKLVAIVAYYPNIIPSVHTKYPNSIQVLVHLAGTEISVEKHHEVLGIQGKRNFVKKRIDPGIGLGERLNIAFKTYTYTGCEPGFAESDLEEYDPIAAQLAFERSLKTIRKGFRIEPDIEAVRDHHTSYLQTNNTSKLLSQTRETAHVIHAPTLTGGIGSQDISEFYSEFFDPIPLHQNPSNDKKSTAPAIKLLSRTIGTSRIVDEIFLSFAHTSPITWLLPGVPPTNRKIEIVIVSIFHVVGTKLESEHVYWDQASVLVQAGLLDPKLVPEGMRRRKGGKKKGNDGAEGNGDADGGEGIERLPVVGAEAARAVKRGSSRYVNELVPDW
ncbi:hypothetical protein CB0940_09658 [Cercospora beticola]|uniref:Dienelactone hydrolase n=1 Tax=Cercospora beticola TaxID=122368 RepID=A0A2G5HGR3_CERBT|nr:hypothetical protein CB0940_09658 [Cercospora beticola]PIA91734.1 hypothetical protein CB0940_09658 [Cercospora beticola]WPB06004.1 hypothetical protein RHO25_010659 [Cercospora beticola]CAK1365884.1 unnamed protein product [Cercospora beticola]